MPESVLAAAFARVGHTVLHIDRNEYYSGNWASFNLEGLQEWIKHINCSAEDVKTLVLDSETLSLGEGESLVECPLKSNNILNIESTYHCPQGEDIEDTKQKKDVSKSTLHSELEPTSPQEDLSDSQLEAVHPESPPLDGSGDGVVHSGTVSELDMDNLVEQLSRCDVDEMTNELDASGTPNASAGRTADVIDEVNVVKSAESPCECSREPCSSDNVVDGFNGAVKDVQQPEHIEEKVKTSWTQKMIEKQWRRFNFDISPRLLYCRGEMVELLISSDVAKYCEFKGVTRILTLLNEKLEMVPCSRADVFSNQSISMIEKRMLMKLITFCLNFDPNHKEITDFLDKPFIEFLKSRKLTPNITHFVQHSIAMATSTTSTFEGLQSTQKFLQSLGRYGNTAFLWSLYGSGELPQSFCRLCAVFGGIYCLKLSPRHLIIGPDNKCSGIVTTDGQVIRCKWLIMESSYIPTQYTTPQTSMTSVSRGIFLVDQSIYGSDENNLTLLNIPCVDDPNRPITVLELPASSMGCPKDMYMIHVSRQGKCGPKEDLQDALKLFKRSDDDEDERPTVLWSLYFSVNDSTGCTYSDTLPDNVVVLPGPGAERDIDHVVNQVKVIFERLCPGEEFLPKAPDPEDIIFDEGETTTPGWEGVGETGQEGTTQDGGNLTPTEDSTETEQKGTIEEESRLEGVLTEGRSESEQRETIQSDTGLENVCAESVCVSEQGEKS